MPDSRADRAYAALLGLAVGDALGMPTQNLPRATVERLFGELRWFEPGPTENPISHGLPAGHVTDDTDQAVLVAQALLDGCGRVDPQGLARDLLAWEERMRAAGSLDLLGPSTKRALVELGHGTPVGESGRSGDTNGAAMRITPVGVAVPARPLEALVERVAEVSSLTHNTGVAIAGASAVAAAVSTGIEDSTFDEALEAGLRAARLGRDRGSYVPGADVAARIGWAVGLVRGAGPSDRALDLVADLVGTGLATQESVPAAFALLALTPEDPWQACLNAANIGGDSDTIAAMAGAMGGALVGSAAFPAEAADLVTRSNDLDLAALAGGLLKLRDAA